MTRRRPLRGRRRWPRRRAPTAGVVAAALMLMTIVAALAAAARATADADADADERRRANPPPPPPPPTKHQQPQPLHPHPPPPQQLPLRVRANTAVWRIALHHARDCRAAGARSFPQADGGGGDSGGGGGSSDAEGGGPCVNVYGVDVARRRRGAVTWFSMSTEARALREVALSPPLLLPEAAAGNGSSNSSSNKAANAANAAGTADAAATNARARRATAYTMPWRGPHLLAADASTGRARWAWPSAGWWPWQTRGWAAGLPAGSSFALALDRTSAAAAVAGAAGAPGSAALPPRVFVTSAHPPRVFALRAPRSDAAPSGGRAARDGSSSNGNGSGGDGSSDGGDGAVDAGGHAEADVRSASLAWKWAPRASTEPPERARGARSEWEARRALVTDAAGPAFVSPSPSSPASDPPARDVPGDAGGDSGDQPVDDAPRALLFVSLSAPTGYGGSQGWIAALNAAHGVSGGGGGQHGKRGSREKTRAAAGGRALSAAKDAPLLAWESPRVPCALAQVEAHASWALLVAQAQQQQQQLTNGAKRASRRGGDEDDWGAGPAAEAGGGDRERRQASLAADVVLARCAHNASIFWAFDADTGDLLWRREESGGDGAEAAPGSGGGGGGARGRAPLAASYRGALLLPSAPVATPAATFGAAPRVLTAVDLRSGEELWHLGLPLPPPPPPPPPVASSSSSSSSLLLPLSNGTSISNVAPRSPPPKEQHECTAPTVYYDGDVPVPADSTAAAAAAAAAKLGPGAGGTVLVGCACAGKAAPFGAAAARVACAYALDLRTGKQRWARALPASSVESGDATAWPLGAQAWGHAPLVLRPATTDPAAPPSLAAADPPPPPRVAVFVAGRTVHAVATADGAALWDVPLAEGDAAAAWMQPSALWGPSAAGRNGGGGGVSLVRRLITPSASVSASPAAGAVVLVGADSSGASVPPRPRTSVYALDAASGARLWARVFEGWPQPRARPGAAPFAAESGVAAPLRVVLRPPPPSPPAPAAPPPGGGGGAAAAAAAPLPLVLLELCRPANATARPLPPSSSPAAPKCCLRGISAVGGAVRWGFCVEAASGSAATRPAAERAIWVLWWLGALGVTSLALSAVAVGIRGAAEEEEAVGGGGEQGAGGGGGSGGGGAAGAAVAAGGSRPRSSSSRPSSSRPGSRGGSMRGGKAALAAIAGFDPFADGSYGERLLDSEEAEEEAEATRAASAATTRTAAARAGARAPAALPPPR